MHWVIPPDFISRHLEGADVLLVETAAVTIIADKGYNAQARVVEPLLAQGKSVVIPSRNTKKVARDYT